MFRDEISLFGGQRVKDQGHEYCQCRRLYLRSCECWLLLVRCAIVALVFLH